MIVRLSLCVLLGALLTSAKINGTCKIGDVPNNDCTERCCGSGQPHVSFDDRCSCDGDADCGFIGNNNGICCNGQCINKVTTQCCKPEDGSQQPYNIYNQKCCHRDGVREWHQACTCNTDAARQCPDVHGRGETACCTRDKFVHESSGTVINGTCYNPKIHSCCKSSLSTFDALIKIETDPTQQKICCGNIGIIDADKRCPCSLDTDCPGTGDKCCFDGDRARAIWRSGAGIDGIPDAPVGFYDEYGDNNQKCSRNCRTDLGVKPNCRGQCVNANRGDTCCADGLIATDSTQCCSVKPAKFNWENQFSRNFELYVSFNHITEYCCPRGRWYPTSNPANPTYTIPIPSSCNANEIPWRPRCACDTDADCQSGGTCCGGKCTIAAAKEKCCGGFDSSQDPVIIAESQTCCPLVPMGINAGEICPCAADKHCPSGRTCCNGGNCFTNVERGDEAVLNGNDYSGACQGRCINTEYDKCCGTSAADNNTPVICKTKYQKCCGENTNMASCCYKHTETCHKTKPLEGDPKYLCSASIQPSHSIIFHAIVYPIILTFVLIAIYLVAVVHALKGSASRLFTFLTVGFGVLILLLALLLLWSMLWKFSVVAIIGNAAILSAVGTSSAWHRRVAGTLAFIALLYVVDPFNGHSFLSFHWAAHGDHVVNGLQEAAKSSWNWGDLSYSSYSDVNPEACARYYQWFYLSGTDWEAIATENQYTDKFDAHDARRYWGICTLGWVHAINIIAGLLVIFQILVSCLGLFLLVKESGDHVEKHHV